MCKPTKKQSSAKTAAAAAATTKTLKNKLKLISVKENKKTNLIQDTIMIEVKEKKKWMRKTSHWANVAYKIISRVDSLLAFANNDYSADDDYDDVDCADKCNDQHKELKRFGSKQ